MIKKRVVFDFSKLHSLSDEEAGELYNIYKSESGATLYIPKDQDAEKIKAEIGAINVRPISKTNSK